MKTSVKDNYKIAKKILGVDFITTEEVMKARPSIVYTDEQITALSGNLPSEDVLKWCKGNGYAVIPTPPTAMSTLDVQEIKSAHFYSKKGRWYDDQNFAHEDKTSFGWLSIKKTQIFNSTNKNWNEQIKLLSEHEKVPNTGEMTWFITTYFEILGVRLFEGVYVRTSSLDSVGGRVIVGHFDSDGLVVGNYWVVNRCDNLGLSAARK